MLNNVALLLSVASASANPWTSFWGDWWSTKSENEQLKNELKLLKTVAQVPGVKPGVITLAQDVDYPPYAFMSVPPQGDFELAGMGKDIAMGLMEVCPELKINVRQTSWVECWDGSKDLNTYGQGPKAGLGLEEGFYHGCMTYTHTSGVRNRYVEFTDGFLQANKPAGLLTRLNANGVPHVLPNSTLDGLTIVDVSGWAPTADGLSLVDNKCTNRRYSGYTIVTPPRDGNDAAMEMLMSGQADAIWIYADQAHNYQPTAGAVPSWNTTLWEGFGTKYAYVGTGMFGHAYNGTTLAMSKIGSGIAEVINPCLQAYMKTRSYFDVCVKHGQEKACYPNQHFSGHTSSTPKPWLDPTNLHTGDCSAGYCPCRVPGKY